MGLTDSQIDEAAHELQRVIEQCGGEPSEFPYDYLRGILEKLPSSAGGGEPTEPSPCEEAARADLVDELDSMRAVFDGAGNFHHVLSRAMAWINGERAGPVEQPSEAREDHFDLIEAVLMGYPKSMAREDARNSLKAIRATPAIVVAAVDGREAFTTRQLIEGAWCAGYYHAGYTNDSAYADQQATRYADAALTPSPGAAGDEPST